MKKEIATAAIAVLLIFFSVTSNIQFVKVVSANPMPGINPKITIDNPQNATYNIDTVTINFTVESSYMSYWFYSLDGEEIKPIENMTLLSKINANAGKNPSVDRNTLRGSCIFSNLSEGYHNVTFYLINPYEGFSLPLGEEYKKGDVVYLANTSFIVEPTPTALPSPSPSPSPSITQQPTLSPSPTADNTQENFTEILIIISLVTVAVVVGLLVYFRHRKMVKAQNKI